MALKYCFEQKYVARTLKNCKKNDLAVIDTDGIDPAIIKNAINRGVLIYGYLNAGALQKERSYYSKFKHLRLAKYSGWEGEYWIDVTNKSWQKHLIDEAIKMKKLGVIGLYFDNADIYYMCKQGFRQEKSKMMRKAPSATSTYLALQNVFKTLVKNVGLIVMPNGADLFVRKMVVRGNKSLIKTINQEGVLYENFQPQSAEERKYRTAYVDWCKNQGFYTRLIEYVKSASGIEKCKAYCKSHGWQGLYISKHTNLEGD